MLVTKKAFEAYKADVEDERKELHRRYWELYRRHDNLLNYLELLECKVPEKTELRHKGD